MQMQVNALEVEVFHVEEGHSYNREIFIEPGFYWWCCLPGQLPDSQPYGPFMDELLAAQDALNQLNRKVA